MKAILSLIISGALVVSGFGQTRNVLVGTNNTVVQPTNFWSADASNARTGLGLGTAATNPASAFQPSSATLSNLASSNAVNLTNLRATNLVGVIPSSNIPSTTLTNISGTLAIVSGGTGATNAGDARTNLGATSVGGAVFTATNAAAARTAIGALATNGDATNLTNFPTVALASNVTGTIAISNGGSGATTAGGARTNLGLGATWLTNTVASNFRTEIGLGATDQVSFSNIQVGSADINLNPTNLSIKFDTNTTNIVGISGGSGFPKRIVFHVDGGIVSIFSNAISAGSVSGTGINVGSNGMTFATSGIYITKSNLGFIGTGTNSVVGGGDNNQSSGNGSVVGGGENNVSSSLNSTVSGGRNNTASGSRSTVAGGDGNTASGGFSFASGRRSKATNTGAFVFSDSTDDDFSSTNDNSFNIRAGGGLSLDLGTNGIGFRNITNAAVTRTNLGLGASWLISTNTPVFVGTNGEVVSPTNFWQVAPINTRVQYSQPVVTATNSATNARNLYLYSLAISTTGVTNTITLPTNAATFLGDVATVIHEGPTSSVTAIRQIGSATNIIALNQFQEAVQFIYNGDGWKLADNISHVEPIYFSGTNASANAAASRTNLGLGSTNDVTFNNITIADQTLTLSHGPEDDVFVKNESGGLELGAAGTSYVSVDPNTASFKFFVPAAFSTTTNAAITRTNLGIGLHALTNTSVTNFQKAIFHTNTAPSNVGGNLGTIAAWIEIVASNGVTYKIPAYTNVP